MNTENREIVQNINLSIIKEKFKSKKGWWWQLWHNADDVEREYRQFLLLVAENPGKIIVPWSQDLDDFWHEHILDTVKYQRDCDEICGKFIHHDPNIKKNIKIACRETKRIYRELFSKKARASVAAQCGTKGNVDFVFFEPASLE